MTKRSFRDMNLAIFRGEDPGGVLWQPRIDFWYRVNKKRGTLPNHLNDASLNDLYDYCHASIRYFTKPLKVNYHSVSMNEIHIDDDKAAIEYKTPIGTLREVYHYDEWGLSRFRSEYKIKTPEDFRVLKYILQDEEWTFDEEIYQQDVERVGDRGAPQFYFRRCPLQGLFVEHMGFERAIFALHDSPEVIHDYIEAATQADEALYKVLCGAPVPIFNYGENIDAHMNPPPIWCDYLAPYYRMRLEQFHAVGKFVHIHADGAIKPLLPFLRDCPFDAIEAATPEPQGDVTIEQIKEALGDMILLDGIPALYFLPLFSEEVLVECVKKLVDLFHPQLVLGISDEIPPDGDIERVRMVGEMAKMLR